MKPLLMRDGETYNLNELRKLIKRFVEEYCIDPLVKGYVGRFVKFSEENVLGFSDLVHTLQSSKVSPNFSRDLETFVRTLDSINSFYQKNHALPAHPDDLIEQIINSAKPAIRGVRDSQGMPLDEYFRISKQIARPKKFPSELTIYVSYLHGKGYQASNYYGLPKEDIRVSGENYTTTKIKIRQFIKNFLIPAEINLRLYFEYIEQIIPGDTKDGILIVASHEKDGYASEHQQIGKRFFSREFDDLRTDIVTHVSEKVESHPTYLKLVELDLPT